MQLASMKRIAVSPYLLLVLTTLFWSGNFVLARLVRLDVPPVGLSFWRWTLAGLLLLPLVWRDMLRSWPLVRRHFWLVAALALLGITNFNTFVYLGLQTTTATNGVLLQSVIPLIIILLSWLILGVRINRWQGLGIIASLAGVLMIITRGDPASLLGLNLVRGDLWILAAVFSWGLYSILLRKLPQGFGGLSLLGYTISLGVLGIAPFYLIETGSGLVVQLNQITIFSVLYVAIFPSLLAYFFWNRAVGEVGPNRAGQFIHLIPVFGSLLSVVLLGERLYLYHMWGVLLVALGIFLGVFLGSRKQAQA